MGRPRAMDDHLTANGGRHSGGGWANDKGAWRLTEKSGQLTRTVAYLRRKILAPIEEEAFYYGVGSFFLRRRKVFAVTEVETWCDRWRFLLDKIKIFGTEAGGYEDSFCDKGRWLLQWRRKVTVREGGDLDGGDQSTWRRRKLALTEESGFHDRGISFCSVEGWCPWRRKAVHEAEDDYVPNSPWRTHEIIHSLFLYIPGSTQQHNWVYVYLGDRRTSWAFFIHLKFWERYQLGMNFSSNYSSVWRTVQKKLIETSLKNIQVKFLKFVSQISIFVHARLIEGFFKGLWHTGFLRISKQFFWTPNLHTVIKTLRYNFMTRKPNLTSREGSKRSIYSAEAKPANGMCWEEGAPNLWKNTNIFHCNSET